MARKTLYVSNDNGKQKAGVVLGRRTFRSLNIIEDLLYDIRRGHCQLPEHYVQDLKQDQYDIITSGLSQA